MPPTKTIIDCSTGTATQVPLTQAEIDRAALDLAAAQASIAAQAVLDGNAASLRTLLAALIAAGSPARNAVAGNTTFIALGTPTNAQVVAQVKALSQQNNVIIPTLLRTIRLVLGALDDTQ